MFGSKKPKMKEWNVAETPVEEPKTVEEPKPIEEPQAETQIEPKVEKKKEVKYENQTIDMFSLLGKMHSEYAELALKWDGIIYGIANLNKDEKKK